MPHLQFEFSKQLTTLDKQKFTDRIKTLFSTIMDTGTDHIGITIREYPVANLHLGRVKDPNEGTAFINADIREGRTLKQRRDLALAFMGAIHEIFLIPIENMYVIFTEHKGEDFHLHDRFLAGWTQGEDPLA